MTAAGYAGGVRLSAGTVLAERYRLNALLGRGGMGEVWAARHELTGKAVAVKRLVCPDDERGAGEARARFALEAKSACAIEHPNVVEVFDFIESDARGPFIVMELLRGETLAARLARGPLGTPRQTAALLMPVVSAVGAAHERGIVHRDLKPSNIFIDTRAGENRPVIKVLDFGIAKWLTSGRDEGGLRTRTGSALGTPSYMAPEQAVGDRGADHRVDIWSLGVILYEAASGVRPLEGNNAAQLVMRLMSTGIMPIEHLVPELPAPLAKLIGRMLSRDVGRRPEDLREVQRLLGELSGEPGVAFGAPRSRQDEGAGAGTRAAPDGLAPARRDDGALSWQPAAGVLETHAAIEVSTASFAGADLAAGSARGRRRGARAALVGVAGLLAGAALWLGRQGELGSSQPAAPARAPRAVSALALAGTAPGAGETEPAPPAALPSRAPSPARGIAAAPEPTQNASPMAGPPASTLAPRAAHARARAGSRRTGSRRAGSPRLAPGAEREPRLAPARGAAPASDPQRGGDGSAEPSAPLRPPPPTSGGAPRGTACESSAECQSQLCAAYTCQ